MLLYGHERASVKSALACRTWSGVGSHTSRRLAQEFLVSAPAPSAPSELSPETWLGWAPSSGLGLDALKAKPSRPLPQEGDLPLAGWPPVIARPLCRLL